MFKQTILISTVVALLTVTGSADNGEKQNGKQYHKQYNKGQGKNSNSTTDDVGEGQSTDEYGLRFMIEEEKLARDVYLYLYEQWGTRIFSNIGASEQKHMDAVQNLMNNYNINLPSTLVPSHT